MPAIPRKRRHAAVIALALAVLAAGSYVALSRIRPLLTPTGCQAGTGHAAVTLDPEQAAIAATIAGVAHDRRMPARAVTVAYAAALQESKMHNLSYGDRDSVGVFQQRPSEGWGPARKLRDPVYATTRFFQALAGVRGYQRMPVYQAAQAVQRSADGYAYIQYQPMAARLATVFTGRSPHAVWCRTGGHGRGGADLAAARTALVRTFGSLGGRGIAIHGDTPSMLVRPARPALGWEVASWLVTHAARYRIHTVHYGGFQWRSGAGTADWTPDKSAALPSDVKAT